MDSLVKETGKKGFTTYKSNNRYIYSLYEPVTEAERYINSLEKIKSIAITCCGADYINSILINKNIDFIISLEPIIFEQTVKSEKILRVKSTNDVEKILLEKNIHSEDVSLILWQPLIEAKPDIYLDEIKKIKNILLKASISANTAQAYGFKESSNFLLNITTLNNFSILLKNKKKLNNPALILSSGASLGNNIDFIKKVASKAFLFALPSALPFLDVAKIHPDFVIAVDPGYGTYYHLAKYSKPIYLISSLSICPTIFRLKNIKPIIFSYSNILDNILFENTEATSSHAEGSVFINLLRLLPQLGIDEAVLCGQDFGYMDNRSHINEGFFEKEFLARSSYFTPLEKSIKSLESNGDKIEIMVKNKKIKTNSALKLYLEHFLSRKFPINICLPESAFNPISDNFKQITADYIIEKYQKKQGLENTFLYGSSKNMEREKQNLFSILKNLSKSIKNNKMNSSENELIEKLFIDLKNKMQIKKIDKIVRKIN